MEEFTTEELRLIRRALRAFAGAKRVKHDFDLSDATAELADRFEAVIEERGD